jgi:hypothetical protein
VNWNTACDKICASEAILSNYHFRFENMTSDSFSHDPMGGVDAAHRVPLVSATKDTRSTVDVIKK